MKSGNNSSRTLDPGIDTKRGMAMALMVVSSVVISFGGLIIRSLETTEPLVINFYRSAGLLSAVIVFLGIRYRSKFVETLTGIGRLGIIGGVLLSVAGMAHMQAMAHTTIANALFILGSIPFFAALFARILLKEKIRNSTLITMFVAAFGLAVMVREGISIGSGYGNTMGIITAVFFALYAVIIRGKRRTDMMPALIVSSLVIMTIVTVLNKGDLVISYYDLVLCIIWGAVLSGVANFLFIYASRHLAAAEVTLFMLLEFALGPIWVWWFVNEIPSKWTVIGGVMIMAAVAIRAVIELINKPRNQQTISGPV